MKQSSGYTPLHYAAANGLESIVKNLVGRGVDTSVRDNELKTAYDLAVEKGYTAIAGLLQRP
jgi:ankyrin repeat protein